jgi:hypothetical protein
MKMLGFVFAAMMATSAAAGRIAIAAVPAPMLCYLKTTSGTRCVITVIVASFAVATVANVMASRAFHRFTYGYN